MLSFSHEPAGAALNHCNSAATPHARESCQPRSTVSAQRRAEHVGAAPQAASRTRPTTEGSTPLPPLLATPARLPDCSGPSLPFPWHSLPRRGPAVLRRRHYRGPHLIMQQDEGRGR
jgi:hypothetical protein